MIYTNELISYACYGLLYFFIILGILPANMIGVTGKFIFFLEEHREGLCMLHVKSKKKMWKQSDISESMKQIKKHIGWIVWR